MLKDCSMLWPSPISASMSVKTANSLPGSAGTWSPDCTISVSRPMVFKATVLPPVLGPVMTKVRYESPMLISRGTADFPIKGCLAPRMSSLLQVLTLTGLASRDLLNLPLANRKS